MNAKLAEESREQIMASTIKVYDEKTSGEGKNNEIELISIVTLTGMDQEMVKNRLTRRE